MPYNAAEYAQEIEVVTGKARDIDMSLSFTTGSLALADIVDAWFTVKVNETDADGAALITKRLNSGITLTGVTAGVVAGIISLSNADMAALTAGRSYFFDVQIDTTARGPEQAAFGVLTMRHPITQANS